MEQTVSFMGGLETFMAGVLPPVQIFINKAITITTVLKVLPEDFKPLKTDILSNSVLTKYDCFQRFYPPCYSKLYFRKLDEEIESPRPGLRERRWLYGLKVADSESGAGGFRSYILGKCPEIRDTKKCYKVLLDTGAYNNFATKEFMNGQESLSYLALQICGTDFYIEANDIRRKNFRNFDCVLGTRFMVKWRVILDFGNMKCYFTVDTDRYMIPIVILN